MKNENEYNDDAYVRGSNQIENGISTLWEGGASIDNIEDVISNALENTAGHAILVDLDSDGRFASA